MSIHMKRGLLVLLGAVGFLFLGTSQAAAQQRYQVVIANNTDVDHTIIYRWVNASGTATSADITRVIKPGDANRAGLSQPAPGVTPAARRLQVTFARGFGKPDRTVTLDAELVVEMGVNSGAQYCIELCKSEKCYGMYLNTK